MGGFFKAGERYQNRFGEYDVLEVRTPLLLIRYVENGRVQEVEEDLQERIVRNLRREVELANRPPEERKKPKRASRARRKKAKFEGFAAADFQGKIAGTSWRAKTGLGGVMSDGLSALAGDNFDSWVPNRQTAVYVAKPEECSAKFFAETAQFFAQTSRDGLTFGLAVHRPADGDGTTAWDRLMAALAEDDSSAEELRAVLVDQDAELNWYAEASGETGAETIRAQDGELFADKGAVTETDTMDDLIERLKDAPEDQSLTLRIERSLTPPEAIAAGPEIGESVVGFMQRLLGLYRACSG